VPLSEPIPEGGTFFCPQCGALYSVRRPRPSPKRDSNIAQCVVCRQTMDQAGFNRVFRSTSSFIDLKMPNRIR
jgi:hypothetical protein